MKTKPQSQVKPRKSYGISRVDQESKFSHGFYVRVLARKYQPKFFSDGVWGSKRRSLEAAENHRDILFAGLTPKQQARANRPVKGRK